MTQSAKLIKDINGVVYDTKVFRSTYGALETGKFNLVAQQGGTSSGKTYGNLLAIHEYLKKSKESLLCSVVSQNFPHLRRGALRDYDDIISKVGGCDGFNKTSSTAQVGNSEIEFFSVDNEGKARGSRRDILFINEANQIPYDIYYQLNMRTRRCTIIDWNPSGEFWFHEKVLKIVAGQQGEETPEEEKIKLLYKITTYKDNPKLEPKIKADIEQLKYVDPELYRVYALGLTGRITGVIFERVKTCFEFPKECKKVAYGLDFGFANDPTALIKAGELHGEIFGQELIYERGLTNDDIAERFKLLGIHPNDEIFADSAEPKSIEELRRKGYNVKPAKKGADSVLFGIDLLKRYQLNITADSINWHKEFRNYKWQEKDGDKLNKPIDAYNHAIDALRYYGVMKLAKLGQQIGFIKPPANWQPRL